MLANGGAAGDAGRGLHLPFLIVCDQQRIDVAVLRARDDHHVAGVERCDHLRIGHGRWMGSTELEGAVRIVWHATCAWPARRMQAIMPRASGAPGLPHASRPLLLP